MATIKIALSMTAENGVVHSHMQRLYTENYGTVEEMARWVRACWYSWAGICTRKEWIPDKPRVRIRAN